MVEDRNQIQFRFARLRALAAHAPTRRTIKATGTALALAMLQASPAFAGGSGLELETALNPFVVFFISFVMPVIGIASLVGAGVAFVHGGARATGNVAVILLGVALVGFAVPIAASRFGLTQGALLW